MLIVSESTGRFVSRQKTGFRPKIRPRGSNRRDELMPEIRDILDEVFSLMQQQMRARPDNPPATETEEYKRRAERIEHLLSYLIREGPHSRSNEMPYD